MLQILRKVFWFVCVLALFSVRTHAESLSTQGSLTASLALKPKLRLAGPPWEPFLHESQTQKGLATEIVVEALERAGYEVEVSIKPWRRVLAEAEKGMVDILIGLWFNEERASKFAYSDPYYVNQISFVAHKRESFTYRSLEQLKGRKVGVRKGASFGESFDQASFLNKSATLNSISMLRMLALGRVDLGIDDRLILNRLMQKDAVLSEQLRLIEPVYIERALHMGVVRSLPEHLKIVADFNDQLDQMIKQGSLKKIHDSYRYPPD